MIDHIKGRFKVTETGCHEWTGWRNKLGYGETYVGKKRFRTHRVVYAAHHGAIPKGMQVCHRCDNPACCNIEHLFLGTAKDNCLDSIAKGRHFTSAKTECKRGHSFAEHGWIDSNGKRCCKICNRARQRIACGWPEGLAYSLPKVPRGYRPVNLNIKTPPKNRRPGVRTHCIHGHPLSGDNLYIAPSDGRRQCRRCKYDVVLRIAAKRKAQINALTEGQIC